MHGGSRLFFPDCRVECPVQRLTVAPAIIRAMHLHEDKGMQAGNYPGLRESSTVWGKGTRSRTFASTKYPATTNDDYRAAVVGDTAGNVIALTLEPYSKLPPPLLLSQRTRAPPSYSFAQPSAAAPPPLPSIPSGSR